jgi:hypothetical protein
MLGGKDETPDAGAGLDNGGPIGTPGSSKPANERAAGGCRITIEGGRAAPDGPGAGYSDVGYDARRPGSGRSIHECSHAA